MSTVWAEEKEARAEQRRAARVTKKNQIRSLYLSGITDVEELAAITGSRPGYIAKVLQDSGLLSGYFDLYTTTAHPMNVYSKFFARKLGFKDAEAAQGSVELIDHLYRQFERERDRAGQHHALQMALTMFNRARWIGKEREADVFRQWLMARLGETDPVRENPTTAEGASLAPAEQPA